MSHPVLGVETFREVAPLLWRDGWREPHAYGWIRRADLEPVDGVEVWETPVGRLLTHLPVIRGRLLIKRVGGEFWQWGTNAAVRCVFHRAG